MILFQTTIYCMVVMVILGMSIRIELYVVSDYVLINLKLSCFAAVALTRVGFLFVIIRAYIRIIL